MAFVLQNVTRVVNGKTHIKPTSLTFQTGHFNVLLGQTGAGKTSLIKLMAGLDAVTDGKIILDNEDITQLSTQKRKISLVQQFFINYPHMTVFENIASPLRVAGMARSEIEGRVEEAANILKLTPELYQRPHQLSGGQQQRTALARAIAKPSRAVFLDEPLANLDYKLREELRELLPELFADRGAVVVYATSEPEEALLLGGKTALMEDGYVRQFGDTADIYRNPVSLASSMIFSNPPINHAQVEKRGGVFKMDDIVWDVPRDIQNLEDGAYQMAIRPHHILPQQTKNARLALKACVGITELSGSESSAHFRFGVNNWVSLAHGIHRFCAGENHIFYLDVSQCLYFDMDGARIA